MRRPPGAPRSWPSTVAVGASASSSTRPSRSPTCASRRCDENAHAPPRERVMIPILGADPLFRDGIDTTVVVIVLVKTILVFVILLVAVMFYVWFMRKVIADMQNRIGPQRAGPFGAFQPLADGIKLFFKEQSSPTSADPPVFKLAPYLAIIPAFLAFAIVPIGGLVTVAG